MDEQEKDLAIGAVGAVVLVVLVVVLFYVGEAAPAGDDGTGTGAGDGPGGGSPGDGTGVTYDNDTFTGTVPAGAVVGGDETGSQEQTHTFEVANGTFEIVVNFSFATGPDQQGDLDCHLYDPDGTKHGDQYCHQGTPDDPQGGEFNLTVNASQTGDWEVVVHTGESGDTNLNSEIDYTVEIVRLMRE